MRPAAVPSALELVSELGSASLVLGLGQAELDQGFAGLLQLVDDGMWFQAQLLHGLLAVGYGGSEGRSALLPLLHLWRGTTHVHTGEELLQLRLQLVHIEKSRIIRSCELVARAVLRDCALRAKDMRHGNIPDVHDVPEALPRPAGRLPPQHAPQHPLPTSHELVGLAQQWPKHDYGADRYRVEGLVLACCPVQVLLCFDLGQLVPELVIARFRCVNILDGIIPISPPIVSGPIALSELVSKRCWVADCREGGRVNNPLDSTALLDRLDQVLRAHHRSVIDGSGSVVAAITHGRAHVHHCAATFERHIVAALDQHVGGKELEAPRKTSPGHLQEMRALALVLGIADAGVHRVAFLQQAKDRVRADVAAGAGHCHRAIGRRYGRHG
mmetsp:Transcript_15108/g.31634  ORF Transcript_15108/g.31634 Transcript_15108/m.31634 type:complete len:385 (+) Transcript_15108:69-1223(+)